MPFATNSVVVFNIVLKGIISYELFTPPTHYARVPSLSPPHSHSHRGLVFLWEPFCMPGVLLRLIIVNCVVKSTFTRPVQKNLFLEFPKYPGSFMLHFDRYPNVRKGVLLKYRSFIKFWELNFQVPGAQCQVT